MWTTCTITVVVSLFVTLFTSGYFFYLAGISFRKPNLIVITDCEKARFDMQNGLQIRMCNVKSRQQNAMLSYMYAF